DVQDEATEPKAVLKAAVQPDCWRSLHQPDLRAAIVQLFGFPLPVCIVTAQTLAEILQAVGAQKVLVCHHLVKLDLSTDQPAASQDIHEADMFEQLLGDWPLPLPFNRSPHGAHKFGPFDVSFSKKASAKASGPQEVYVSYVDPQDGWQEVRGRDFLRRVVTASIDGNDLQAFLLEGKVRYPNYLDVSLVSEEQPAGSSRSGNAAAVADGTTGSKGNLINGTNPNLDSNRPSRIVAGVGADVTQT
ncbi:unnamed protein product, partial [Amoebophrya sp. A25]